jgi:hypothetical protein
MELGQFVAKYRGLADVPVVVLEDKAFSARELVALVRERPEMASSVEARVREVKERVELDFEYYRFLAAKYFERKVELERFYPRERKIVYASLDIPGEFLTVEQAYYHVVNDTPTGRRLVENFKHLHKEVVRRLRE